MAIVRHVSREPRPVDRGYAFGQAWPDAVRNTVTVYRRMFAEDAGLDEAALQDRGRSVETIVRDWRPALCEEIEGLAVGAGQPPEMLYAINARSELLVGGLIAGATPGECSALAVVAPDRTRGMLGQTWDFHPAVRPSRVLWTVHFGDGRWLTTFTEAGIVAKLGVSSHGIALGLNLMSTDRDIGSRGVPVHILARVLLEEATTIGAARRLVESAPAAASACITLLGPDGSGAIGALALERWPEGNEVLGGQLHAVAHTNHFLTPIGAVDLMRDGPAGTGSALRLAVLRAAIDAGIEPNVGAFQRVLSSESDDPEASIFHHDDIGVPWILRNATILTLVIEVPSGALWLRSEGDPNRPLTRVDHATEKLGCQVVQSQIHSSRWRENVSRTARPSSWRGET